MSSSADVNPVDRPEADGGDQPRSRRSLLMMAAAAGATVVGGTVIGSGEASAANGDPLRLGVDVGQVATRQTGFAVQSFVPGQGYVAGYGLAVTDEGLSGIADKSNRGAIVGHAQGKNFDSGVSGYGTGFSNGVYAYATSTSALFAECDGNFGVYARGKAAAVSGESTSTDGAGVQGYSPTGPALEARGSGLIRRSDASGALPPGPGRYYQRGDLLSGPAGSWVCVTSGNPAEWRKLAGNDSAGTFHLITPKRIVNTLVSGGIIPVGGTRTVTANLAPAGATAAVVTITAVQTSASGSLVAYETGTSKPNTFSLSWTGANAVVSNTLPVALNAARKFTVQTNGAATHIYVDMTGFYR